MTRQAEIFVTWLLGPEGGGSTERPLYTLNLAKNLADTEGNTFWAIVAREWSGFDLIPHADFEIQFRRFADTAPGTETSIDIRLYRGQDASDPVGLAWTSCIDVAEDFARGHRGLLNPNPVILETLVQPKKIAFECTDRGESEYVLFSPPTSYRSGRSMIHRLQPN